MKITDFDERYVTQMVEMWNISCEKGEMLYKRITAEEFMAVFLNNINFSSEFTLVAEDNDGKLAGFISGLIKKEYLRNEDFDNTPGYITMLIVDSRYRHQGIARQLLNALEEKFRLIGKKEVRITYRNPINLTWIIPGTGNHDHNNAPGVDVDSNAYRFFKAQGYETLSVEFGMYMDLDKFKFSDKYFAAIEKQKEAGIIVELYKEGTHHGFEELFDHLKGEVWRKTINDNLAKQKPLPIIVASHEGKICGFAGPIDRQASGRGWFNGIATDPYYERKGIAYVMFNRLMWEFKQIGAKFSTLFTDDRNPAYILYEKTGFSIAKKFAVMGKKM